MVNSLPDIQFQALQIQQQNKDMMSKIWTKLMGIQLSDE